MDDGREGGCEDGAVDGELAVLRETLGSVPSYPVVATREEEGDTHHAEFGVLCALALLQWEARDQNPRSREKVSRLAW